VPDVILPAAVRASIAAHTASAYPEEACGILIGVRPDGPASLHIERALACANIAPPATRLRRFEIDPRVVIETQRGLRGSGAEIVGFYHSHPDSPPTPSDSDLPYFRLWPCTVWLIASAQSGLGAAARAWWFEPEATAPMEMTIRAMPARSEP
jgi:proteasome lid subunit RPN8/RPN11